MEKKLLDYAKERHPAIRKQKTIRYLMQRGFEYDLIIDTWKQHYPQ